jgi:hypothetical protein
MVARAYRQRRLALHRLPEETKILLMLCLPTAFAAVLLALFSTLP